MATIGPGWADGAWIVASWVSTAWGAVVAVVGTFIPTFRPRRR